jgi:hypothetical protein
LIAKRAPGPLTRTVTRLPITWVMDTNGEAKPVLHEQLGLRLAGLALGLGEPGQAALAGHVAVCVTCAARLDDLVAVAGTLSLLAPEADPPSGFEGRLLEGARARALCK